MARSASLVLLAGTTSLAALIAIGCGGVSTPQGATSSPTPSGTHTPFGTPTPTGTTTGTTPTPTPSGTPAPAAATCSFVWLNDYTNVDGTFDFYEVDIPDAAWTPATTQLDATNVVAYWASGYDPNTGSVSYGAGQATNGSIALQVSTTTPGTPAGYTDSGNKNYYDASGVLDGSSSTLGSQVATGGSGSFSGNLSDPTASAPDPSGTGTMTVTDGSGNSEVFGDPNNTSAPASVYALCQ